MAVKKTQLYASLWASCDKLRGGMDSSEYKDYILTLLFMKYVTDKFKNKGAYEDIRGCRITACFRRFAASTALMMIVKTSAISWITSSYLDNSRLQ